MYKILFIHFILCTQSISRPLFFDIWYVPKDILKEFIYYFLSKLKTKQKSDHTSHLLLLLERTRWVAHVLPGKSVCSTSLSTQIQSLGEKENELLKGIGAFLTARGRPWHLCACMESPTPIICFCCCCWFLFGFFWVFFKAVCKEMSLTGTGPETESKLL